MRYMRHCPTRVTQRRLESRDRAPTRHPLSGFPRPGHCRFWWCLVPLSISSPLCLHLSLPSISVPSTCPSVAVWPDNNCPGPASHYLAVLRRMSVLFFIYIASLFLVMLLRFPAFAPTSDFTDSLPLLPDCSLSGCCQAPSKTYLASPLFPYLPWARSAWGAIWGGAGDALGGSGDAWGWDTVPPGRRRGRQLTSPARGQSLPPLFLILQRG